MGREPARLQSEASARDRVFVILLHKNTKIQFGTLAGPGQVPEARVPAGASYSKSGEKAWSVVPF